MYLGKHIKRRKNRLVYISRNNPANGFTLVTALFSLTLLLLILPFLTITVQMARGLTDENTIDVQHFFIFLRDDVIEASDVVVNHKSLTLTLITGNKATYSLLGDVIRRRIQSLGHEIYIRGIRDITFTRIEDRIHVELITTKGEHYEKEIQIYD